MKRSFPRNHPIPTPPAPGNADTRFVPGTPSSSLAGSATTRPGNADIQPAPVEQVCNLFPNPEREAPLTPPTAPPTLSSASPDDYDTTSTPPAAHANFTSYFLHLTSHFFRPLTSRFSPFLRFALLPFFIFNFSFLISSIASSPPSWWTAYHVTDPERSPDDYAVINQGQLKNLASKAALAMNETLPGGAGTTVNAMVTQWTSPPQPGSPPRDDYAAVTLGQLKATALPFYQRLHALGYITQNDYLWAQNTTASFHANVANIGQAKNLFAFALPTAGDASLDSDGDGIPDFWERLLGTNPFLADADQDPNNTGQTNAERYATALANGTGTITPGGNNNNNNSNPDPNTPDSPVQVDVTHIARPFYAVVDLGEDENYTEHMIVSERNGWVLNQTANQRWHNGIWQNLNDFAGTDRAFAWDSDIRSDGAVFASGWTPSPEYHAIPFLLKADGNFSPLPRGDDYSYAKKFLQNNKILYFLSKKDRQKSNGFLESFSPYSAIGSLLNAPSFSPEPETNYWSPLPQSFNRNGDSVDRIHPYQNTGKIDYGIVYDSSLPRKREGAVDEAFPDTYLASLNLDRMAVGLHGPSPIFTYNRNFYPLPLSLYANSPTLINAPQGDRAGFYTISDEYNLWYRKAVEKKKSPGTTGNANEKSGSLIVAEPAFIESQNGTLIPDFAMPVPINECFDHSNAFAYQTNSFQAYAINDEGLLVGTGFYSSGIHLLLLIPADYVQGVPGTKTETFGDTQIYEHPGLSQEEIGKINTMDDAELSLLLKEHTPVTFRLIAFNDSDADISNYRLKAGDKEFPLKKFKSRDRITGVIKDFLYPYEPNTAWKDSPKLFLPARSGANVGERLKAHGYDHATRELRFSIIVRTGAGAPGVNSGSGTYTTNSTNSSSTSSGGTSVASNVAAFANNEIMLVDANRDGKIDDNDKNIITRSNPWRFWVNDDSDSGDVATDGSDIPGATEGHNYRTEPTQGNNSQGKVDGRSDLIDFFPVWVDLKRIFERYPPSEHDYRFRREAPYAIRSKNSSFNLVWTELKQDEALKYQRETLLSAPELYKANTEEVTELFIPNDPKDPNIPKDFIDFAQKNKTKDGKSYGLVILLEGRFEGESSLWFEVTSKQDAGISKFSAELPIRLSSINEMYRWINLRKVTGQDEKVSSNIAEPPNWPDAKTNGKQFIFVHGYNVNETQSRAWGSEVFKRLFWSKSKAMFTMVSWHGDESQIFKAFTPNYWINVFYAFLTAKELPEEISKLPGTEKIIAAHSLGNMVVSAAIGEHQMKPTKYFMLDAAVPKEAYFSNELNLEKMAPKEWYPKYSQFLWASNWWELFLGSKDDLRKNLKWTNRFENISNTYNFYSSGEEVLDYMEGDASKADVGKAIWEDGNLPAWVLQEKIKGLFSMKDQQTSLLLPPFVNLVLGPMVLDSGGGWGINKEDWKVYKYLSPFFINNIDRIKLRDRPFFKRFSPDISGDKGGVLTEKGVYYLLASAIPALSIAAGKERVDGFEDRNFDLTLRRNESDIGDFPSAFQNGWPYERTSRKWKYRWRHSDAKDIAYFYNFPLYDKWVELGELNKERKP